LTALVKELRATVREEGLETETMRDGKVRGDLWVNRLSAEQEADMMGRRRGRKRMQYSGDRRREEERIRVVIKDGRLAMEEERKEEEKKKEKRDREG
jgi:hypothetical protein